jgi:hypothetical protein
MTAVDTDTPNPNGKPPAASLSTISYKGKVPPPRKSGDLTRLFEMARTKKEPSTARGEVVPIAMPEPSHEPPAETPSPAWSAPESPALAALDLTSAAPSDTVEPLTLSLDAVEPPPGELTVAAVTPETPAEAPASATQSPVESVTEIVPMSLHAITTEPVAPETLAAPAHTVLPSWVMDAAEPPLPVKEFPELAPEPEIAVETTPVQAPDPGPEPPVPAAEPVAAETPREFETLTEYWRFLRGDQEFPAASHVDRRLVAERWPSSLLLAFAPMSSNGRGEPELAQVTRLGRACADAESAVEYSPYATRWMLELGRAALRAGEPVEELARLSTAEGGCGFRLVALPLGPAGADPDSVLCELVPSTAAPRFGKRRVWLED